MHGNWKLQVENGLDGYHGAFTHKSFFRIMERRTGKNVRFVGALPTSCSKAFRNGHSALDPEAKSQQPLLDRIAALPDATPLLAQLRAQVSEEEYDELVSILPGAGINVGIYPNLQFIGVHIRRIDPIAVDRTLVSVRPLLFKGVPPEFNYLRLRYHELFYGPAGFGQPDDFEMFSRVEKGLDDTEDSWLRFERGIHDESGEDDTRVGQVSDETPQRGQYRAWKQLMSADCERS
jgi:hypothetical protein